MTSRGKIVEKQLGYDLFSKEPLAPTATANLTVFCASIHNCCVQVNTSEANSLLKLINYAYQNQPLSHTPTLPVACTLSLLCTLPLVRLEACAYSIR